MKNSDTPQQQKATKNIRKLIQALEPMATDSQLATEVKVLEQNISIFDQLRQALRIALPQTKNGLNDQGADIEIKTIEKDVSKFTQEVKNRQDYLQNKDLHKAIFQ